MDELEERYSRQMLFARIGRDGQSRIRRSTVGLVGLGALGCTIAEMLVRAGVGRLIAVDRDVVERSNLHRQGLYLEEDAAEGLPKAVAAAKRLGAMNPDVEIQAHAEDYNADNAVARFGGADLLIDGTDSFESRYLLNDLAVSLSIPWIYGACVASGGMTMTIVPQKTPCLACIFPEPPPAGIHETCDTAGIIAPAAHIAASIQTVEALKILSGRIDDVRPSLLSFDLWPFRIVEVGKQGAIPNPDCRACSRKDFIFLAGERESKTVKMCGRNSVQIHPGIREPIDLAALAARLRPVAAVVDNGFAVTITVPEATLTVFSDGRCLVRGTTDPGLARSLHARWIGA